MCIFCKIVAKEIPADIVFESIGVLAFNDITPQAPTHVLVIPKWHHETAADLAVADQIAKTRDLDGYRLAFNTGESAGQSVFHAHLHLLGGRPLAWPPG